MPANQPPPQLPPPPQAARSQPPPSPRQAPPLFTIRGLTKAFAGRKVLDGLDFEILRGECFVILGRSGSGKSVTLRQLNGLDKPDAGQVVFDGTDVTALAERETYPMRRRIAMLFQGGALFDSMTVFDNVAFPLREHTRLGAAEIAAKVQEKLGLVHLPDAGPKMPADLSGGMRKRAALARSLALDPEVVLYDEPTTGLDPMTSAAIGQLIRQIHRRLDVTQVVITHDLALARHVADRLAYLSNGRFTFVGDWAAAERCTDPELAGFLAGREWEEEDDHGA
ncbi:MAG TPA: ATP-binding cassette domain-containing protein [Thermoanaerobaculia bacterium]|nr:ATP-binding cassette domain-containing protein [Thermoanaerobaculia bacterium]